MDKILSARVDESILNKISFLARKLHVSKKKVIEGAVELYAQKLGSEGDMNVFQQTSGIWARTENPQETVSDARTCFRKSFKRYQK